MSFDESGLETVLPDSLYAVTEVVEDSASGDAAAGGEEAADDAGDVTTDVEVLGIVDTDTLYAKAEPADAGEHDGMTLAEPLPENLLKFRCHTDDGALRKAAVTTSLGGYLVECHLALTDCFCEVFTIRTAALDIVLDKPDMYCHFL